MCGFNVEILKVENVVELINAINTYEKENNDSDIMHYLQEIALYTDSDDKKKKTDSVSLMTVHTAKGTEFPIVFVTAFNENVLHSSSQKWTH